MTQSGPRLTVFKKYSEVSRASGNTEELYWELLQKVPRTGAIGVASAINNILAVYARDRAAHEILRDKFVRAALHKPLDDPAVKPPAFTIVFSHYGCLVILRDLLLFGKDNQE